MGSAARWRERIAARVVQRDRLIRNLEQIEEAGHHNPGSVTPCRACNDERQRLGLSDSNDHGSERPKTILQHLEVAGGGGRGTLVGGRQPMLSGELE